MSKQIATIPFEKISKIQIYINKNKKTLADVKKETGADYIINGGLYNPNWTACPLCKSEDKIYSLTPWREFGFGWNSGSDITMRSDYENVRNFISCVPLIRNRDLKDLRNIPSALDGARQRTAMAVKSNNLILYCTNIGTTPKTLQQELKNMGCHDAIMLDGGGSSQCDFNGVKIKSARVVQNLILVYTKGAHKEEGNNTVKKKIVCIDPGHGFNSVNCSPDKLYWEHEFAMDMGVRIEKLLKNCGIEVVLTRHSGTQEYPSLTERSNISNRARADCFVSLHSNATNGGWASARGLMIYTSAEPMTAQRNILASKLIESFKEQGVLVRQNALLHEHYTVLMKTQSPACLIEYGFHTNKEDVALLSSGAYRDKLAVATAKGICNYLGVQFVNTAVPTPPTDSKDVASWAKTSWEKATAKKIVDGTRPTANVARQELTVILDRLGLLN